MFQPAHRRVFGILLGLVLGIVFGAISQAINFLFLPGMPLDLPPFGPVGNAIMAAVLGTLVGITLSWPDNSALGVILASLIGALALSFASLFTGKIDPSLLIRKITALLIILVPTAGLLSLPMMFLRWVINREELSAREMTAGLKPNHLLRVGLPSGLLVVTILLAVTTSLIPAPGRLAVSRMQALIEQGRQAGNVEQMPEPLRPPDVEHFREQAQGSYTISWSVDEKNIYAIPRPAGSLAYQSTVVARFPSGYLLVCVMPDPKDAPTCRDFLHTPDFLQ